MHVGSAGATGHVGSHVGWKNRKPFHAEVEYKLERVVVELVVVTRNSSTIISSKQSMANQQEEGQNNDMKAEH